jgi:hypothetical protein
MNEKGPGENMTHDGKMRIANSLMLIGLLPYTAVFTYFVWMSDARGDAAMAAIFTTILGLGIAYLVALGISFPAYIWSRALVTSHGADTRLAIILRWSVLCGVFPAFAVFPCLARALFW